MQNEWAQIQSILEKRIGSSGQVKAWIASLQPQWDGSELVLCAQTEFAASHVRQWYGTLLLEAAAEVFAAPCHVSIVCSSSSQLASSRSAVLNSVDCTPQSTIGPRASLPCAGSFVVGSGLTEGASSDKSLVTAHSQVPGVPLAGIQNVSAGAVPGALHAVHAGAHALAGFERFVASSPQVHLQSAQPGGTDPIHRGTKVFSHLELPVQDASLPSSEPHQGTLSPDQVQAPSGGLTRRLEPRPLPITQSTQTAAQQLSLPVEAAYSAPLPAEHLWRFSFDDFVVGPCNELAYAASRSMCHNERQSDILFLSSAPGLGKTHLIHAVGQGLCLSGNRAKPRAEYLTAEEFASRFYQSIKRQETDAFKSRYRNLDLLLLEDVHFLQGKEKMQAELLATIKAVRERGGKVVFSSSFAPKDLRNMDDQLQSRLCAGLLTFIERPDEETRRKILRSKARTHQVLLPPDVEDILAHHIHADVRQIESCLHNLILKARLFKTAITAQMAWEVVSQYAAHTPVLTLDGIIAHVCKGFNLTREQLVSSSRKQEYVYARNTVFYLARKHTDLSFEAIGRTFNRKHSTVIKGITALEREMSRATPSGRQITNTLAMIERNGNIVCGLQ